MPAHYFQLHEANELLEEIRPLMAELLQRRARAVANRHEIVPILGDSHNNVGSAAASRMAHEFVAIETLIAEIKTYGCHIKDLNSGLLDFLSERNGREIYLCWRYNEPEISFYHELDSGYNGRQPL